MGSGRKADTGRGLCQGKTVCGGAGNPIKTTQGETPCLPNHLTPKSRSGVSGKGQPFRRGKQFTSGVTVWAPDIQKGGSVKVKPRQEHRSIAKVNGHLVLIESSGRVGNLIRFFWASIAILILFLSGAFVYLALYGGY